METAALAIPPLAGLASSPWAYPVLEAVHIAGIAALLGLRHFRVPRAR